MTTVSSETPYVDMDVAIDSLVRQFATLSASTRTAKLQKKLDSLWSKYTKFETRIEKDGGGSLNLGFGEIFKAAKKAGIDDLTARYKGIALSGPLEASGLLAVATGQSSSLSFSRTVFTEADTNDGSVLQSMVVTLTGDSFKGAVGASLGTINDLPGGLTAKLVKTSATTATLTFSGKASAHASEDTATNVVVDFTATDFTSSSIAGKTGLSQTLTFRFFDILASESSGVLTLSAAIETDVTVNLSTDKLLFGAAENILQSGSMANVSRVDASALTGDGSTVSVIGDSEDNSITASNLNGSITGGGGADTISLGTGVYTLVFGASATANGEDTISGFNVVGDSMDILDFSAFLGAAPSGRTPSLEAAGGAAGTLVNGGVMVLYGSGLTTATLVAAEVTASATGKTVIITADVNGDATIWFVTNVNTTALTDTGDSVTAVATLVGVNNLALTDNLFTVDNFL